MNKDNVLKPEMQEKSELSSEKLITGNFTTAREELSKMDVSSAINKMNSYAAMKLRNVDIKQLEGLTADDFTQNVMLKVLEGTYNWQKSATTSFQKFLFSCLSAEVCNLIKKLNRRDTWVSTIDDPARHLNKEGINYHYRESNTPNETLEYSVDFNPSEV